MGLFRVYWYIGGLNEQGESTLMQKALAASSFVNPYTDPVNKLLTVYSVS